MATNKIDGAQVCFTPEGERFEGEYKDGQMHGTGVMELPTGERYEGTFVKGQMDGFGRFTWPNGQVCTEWIASNLSLACVQFYLHGRYSVLFQIPLGHVV